MRNNRVIIYKIENVKLDKSYVGSTRIGLKRWDVHLSVLRDRNKKKHGSSLSMYHDFELYGEDSFKFLILEEFDDSITDLDLKGKELEYIEKLDLFNPDKGYNKRNPLSSKVVTTFKSKQIEGKVSILAIDIQNNVLVFKNLKECSSCLNISKSKIADVLCREMSSPKNRRMSYKGFVFVRERNYIKDKNYWSHVKV